jgi:eukaryotic-like serine/threonine-protein kinase
LAENSSVIYTAPPPGGRYSHLIFLREGRTLMAQPFDDRKMQVAGDPFAVTDRASASADSTSPAASASMGGMLASVSNRQPQAQLQWFDSGGKELEKLGMPGNWLGISLSPDEKTVAFGSLQTHGASLIDVSRLSESRLRDADGAVVWAPDAKTVLYARGRDLYVQDAASGGEQSVILRSPYLKRPSDWSRDGRFVLYTEVDARTQGDIWYMSDPLGKTGSNKPVKFLGTNAMESQGQFSPDGHWIAYYSDESGNGELYVRPFPSGQGKWKVSIGGGAEPRWSADGKGLYFRTGGRDFAAIWVVAVRNPGQGVLEIGVPRKVLEFRGGMALRENNAFSYSPASGGRFLVNDAADNIRPTIILITNWWKLTGAAEGVR